jgi:hypothetical protein
MRFMLTRRNLFGLISLCLIVGILLQSWQVFSRAWEDLLAVRATMGQTALWRSANFRISHRFADYILFLNANIPDDGRVILSPGDGGPKSAGITPFMQFFLAPRQVTNCLDVSCIQNVDRQNTYIPFTARSLVDDLALEPEAVLAFDDEWGLILPVDARLGEQAVLQGFDDILAIFSSFLFPVIWLLILVICGSLLIDLLLPRWTVPHKIVLGYGLGMLVFTLSVSVISLVGVPLSRRIIIWITLTLFIFAVGVYLFVRRSINLFDSEVAQPIPKRARFDPWEVMFLLLGLAAILISVGKGYHTTDAIQIWGAKGYGIAATGFLDEVMSWGTNTVHYPLHVPVLIASFRLFSGDNLPASKMFFSAYYVAILFLIYHALISLNLRRTIAGLGTLLVGTTPVIFRHATIGYANLALTYYIVAAALLLIKSFQTSDHRESYSLALLSGIFFGAASWTRAEGLALSLVSIILIFSMGYLRHRLTIRQAALVLAPVTVYGILWILVKAVVYTRPAANSKLLSTAMSQIMAGNLHLADAWYVISTPFMNLADVSTWGVLGIAVLLVLIFSAIILTQRRGTPSPSLWVGVLLFVLILGMYYLTSFDTKHDISWWVSTGLNRMIFPAIVLLWIGGLGMLQLFDDDKKGSTSTDAE